MAEPPGAVTTTSTAPPLSRAGVVTVMLVPVTAVTVPAVPPNETVVSERVSKFVPLMVTDCPPATEPVLGEMVPMVGPSM